MCACQRIRDVPNTAVESHIERNVTPGEAGDALVYRNWTWRNQGEHSIVGCEKAMQQFR